MKYLTYRSLAGLFSLFLLQLTASAQVVVKIVASKPDASEPSYGVEATPGVFIVSRSGSLDQPLTVFLRYDGTATSGTDYVALPAQVVIQAGAMSTELKVAPMGDLLVEATETVIARVAAPSPSSAGTLPYVIGDVNAQATVFIHDANIPIVSIVGIALETTEPSATTKVAPGQVAVRRTGDTTNPLTVYLDIQGTATPDADYKKIDSSVVIPAGATELDLLVEPSDDQIYEGDETVLIAFAHPPFPFPPPYVTSAEHYSAQVVIHDNDPKSAATIDITAPVEGTSFANGAEIKIDAIAVDPNGYIPAVQFYDGDNSIGRSTIDFLVAPEPGTPVEHTFTWQGAAPGQHTLTVRGQDSAGNLVISAPLHILVGDVTTLPLVSILATQPNTTEPGANTDIAPGVFTLKRTGSTDKSLVVYVAYGGTATKGTDYKELPTTVEFPIGNAEVQLQVLPVDDLLVEGDETVIAELTAPPTANASLPQYNIDPNQRVARVIIHDNDSQSVASIVITDPKEGAVYPLGTPITINATAVDPNGYIPRVEFFDGANRIGVSEIAFLVAPDPGTPVHHSFTWNNAAPGLHTLTVRGANAAGVAIVSPPVHISVTGGDLPVVSIVATQPETREQSPNVLDPTTGAPLVPGIFTLKRTGSTDKSLVVYVGYGGTATRGTDYQELPIAVEFPAGKAEVQLFVVAIDDRLVEGDETVVAELIMPPTAGAALLYNIDPNQRVAKVVIHDNDSAGPATIKITQPLEGDVFKQGSPVTITAVAVDPNGYIPRVEFYDGETKIGVSEIFFIRAPDPGTPITHTFVWNNAPAGDHTLTVRGKDSSGQPVVSPAVHIRVEAGTGTPVVRIYATDPEATELPPNVDAIDPATFTIIRDGDSTRDTLVFYSIHGTAQNGGDYKEIPSSITIPAGQSSARIQIVPVADLLTVVEPMETVGIHLEPSPIVGPMPTYDIDPNAREAAAVIYEGRPPENGALELAIPSDGEHFPAGASIDILAAGVHPPDGVRVVDFYADDQKIGSSEDWTKVLKTVYAHAFTWANPDPGAHILQAKSVLADGTMLVSSKIEIVVGEVDLPVVSVRFMPDLTLRPWPNADFAPGSIEVRRSGSTDVPLTVFYGVSGTATSGLDYKELPGFIEIPKGEAAAYIQVDAIDDQLAEGNETVVVTVVRPPQPVGDGLSYPDYLIDPEHRSATITILDNDSNDTRVVLSIEAADASATEPNAAGVVDNAVFVIKRTAGPNIAVTAVLEISGTAKNGVDYQEIKAAVEIPTDVKAMEVVIKPIQDNLVEGDESVELHLVPPPCVAIVPPPPECYIVGPNNVARAVIHDASGNENHPPKVAITRPADGSVFFVGNPIGIRAEAADSDGTIDHLDLLADGQLLNSTKLSVLEFTWNNVPEGPHTLVARAVDNLGAEGHSAEVRILVRRPELVAFVRRDLPPAYTPSVAFAVQLRAEPPQDTHAYAVEDRPPTGWTVSEISNEGVFDPATGKVKFGPFFDAEPRTLAYKLTPPADATGRKEFGGSSSINGAIYPIVGDRLIESVNSTAHPADTSQDKSINLAELTAYAAAWKQGDSWPTGPSPIPMSFVTRAAMIWRHGEAYTFDPNAGAPPLCWLPVNQNTQPLGASSVATTERSTATDSTPGTPFAVQITITPSSDVSSYAVEEKVPVGWLVSNISDDGSFDSSASVIRWGVFLDNNSRVLKYTLTPPATVASIGLLGGFVSFDGITREVSGSARVIATDDGSTVHLDKCERTADGSIQLQLSGAVGQIGSLESSSDLINWTEVKTVFLPDGIMNFSDDSSSAEPMKYYRLRIR